MAKNNFKNCLAVTLPHEGGWADHPKDPGGATMKGVTLATFRRWVPGATKADLRAISDAWVEEIYESGYWDTINGDRLPAGVDLVTFDFGVNSGPSRAARYLQAVLGTAQDGAVGNKTVQAALAADPVTVAHAVCAKRLGFVKGLSTFATFGTGWSRRIADVEAKGVKMAIVARGVSDDYVRDALADLSDAALATAKGQDKAAVGTAGGGATLGAGDALMTGDLNMWLIGGLVALAGFAVLAIKSRSRINKDRADAYHEAAIHA